MKLMTGHRERENVSDSFMRDSAVTLSNPNHSQTNYRAQPRQNFLCVEKARAPRSVAGQGERRFNNNILLGWHGTTGVAGLGFFIMRLFYGSLPVLL